jgi:penicillin-binding protein 2
VTSNLRGGADPFFEQRLRVTMLGVACMFLVFLFRLFQLQIVQGEELHRRSLQNSIRSIRLEAPRGEILDREGRVLATTRPAFHLELIPSELRHADRTYAALGQLLGLDPERLRERVGDPKGRVRFQPVRLAADLSWSQLARVESHGFKLPGIFTEIRARRHYPEGVFAAHALGTIGEIDSDQLETRRFAGYRAGHLIGQSGIEALLESHLHGRAGGRNVVVDVAGREVEVLNEMEPRPGRRVILSLDLDLQRAAEQGFAASEPDEPPLSGALVALDPRSGEVLALTSQPSFDPNRFAGGMDADAWRGLTEDPELPLQNRALAGQYPPGSTYKPFVAAALLAKKAMKPNDLAFCPGHFTLGRRTYRCWKRVGHGPMTLHEALVQSCDVYFYQAGLEVGIDPLAEVSKKFGFGRPTGIALPSENPGLVPTSRWKERRFGQPWMRGETVSASIGQGFNLITPLQMAVAYAALANGGRVLRPRIVLATEEADGTRFSSSPEVVSRVPIAAEHLTRIRRALHDAVSEPDGTGGRARVPGVEVAGKTGTAQVVRLEHTEGLEEEEVPRRYRDHAWFVGFAPAESAEIVVAVLVEHGGHGGSTAAPIVQRVLARYFEKKGGTPETQPGLQTAATRQEAARAHD